MGLDTTHDAWHGPYSAFMRWRTWLAAAVGLHLEYMQGFTERTFTGEHTITPPFSWETMQADPIVLLLHHSDCDGKIPWWQCKSLALRLLQVYRATAENTEEQYPGRSMRQVLLQFAAGCRRAWLARENLRFH